MSFVGKIPSKGNSTELEANLAPGVLVELVAPRGVPETKGQGVATLLGKGREESAPRGVPETKGQGVATLLGKGREESALRGVPETKGQGVATLLGKGEDENQGVQTLSPARCEVILMFD
jgi:hypothetical protein